MEKIGPKYLMFSPPTLTIYCGVSNNDGEISNIGKCLTMLVYHSLNQKANDWEGAAYGAISEARNQPRAALGLKR